MSTPLTIPVILQTAQICEYLAVVNTGRNNAFKGGDIDERLARLIYMERMAVQNRYTLNPSDPTLRGTANYLYSILGYQAQAAIIINNLAQSPPVVIGPSNQSVNVGASATFTIGVTSSLSYTINWYRNGVLIPGQTGLSYTLVNAQLSDSAAQFSAIVTNGAGSTTSAIGVLTVTAALVGYFTYSPTVDFYSILIGNSDPFSYGTTYSITHNAAISIVLPGGMPANQYMLAKIPVGESAKTTWFNTALNNGAIPDSVFEAIVQFGGFTYYASRGQISMDVSQVLALS